MKRLPVYDRPTRQSELAVFLSLGASALALVGFAVFSATEFAAAREGIVAALTRPLPACADLAKGQAAHALTNLTVNQSRAAGEALPAIRTCFVSPNG